MTHRDFYDVVVVGAGAAGVAAAAGAADAGAVAVALMESSHLLGGAVTGAMHRSLCGMYAAEPPRAIDTLNAGMQRYIVETMVRLRAEAVVPRQVGQTWVLEFPPAVWEMALDRVSTRPNLDRLMGCKVSEIRLNQGMVSGVCIDGMSNREVGLRVLIDCTGSGAVLQMCEGVALPAEPGDRMLGGYAIRLSGLTGNLELLRVQIPYVLTRGVLDGELPLEARFTMFQPGPGTDQGICKLAIRPDRFAQEEVELFARSVLELLKGQLPAFAGARVLETSPRAFSRDGCRLHGKYVVTDGDVLSGRRHGDDSVHAWWPIEFWDCTQGPSYAYPPAGEHYDIPTDALQSAVIPNLLAAGTCVSATAKAAASIRGSGICLATGNAAGVLAASMLNH